MDDQRAKAFDFASETTKQLLSLATVIIGLTVTFASDIIKDPSGCVEAMLISAWTSYFLSIVFGLLTLMALTGELQKLEGDTSHPSIRGKNVTGSSIAQVVTFGLGTLLFVIFGIASFTAI